MKKAETGTYHGPRSGPPGDDTVYLMPRDFAAWEKAWDVHAEPLSVTKRGQTVELDMSPEAVAEREERKRRHAEAVAYVNQYTGQWGLPLDIKARRDWGTAKVKLSEAQVEALLKGRDRDLERASQDAQTRTQPDHQRAEAFVRAKALAGSSSSFVLSLYAQLHHRPLSTNQIAAVIRMADEEESREAQRQPASPQEGTGMAPQRAPRSPMGSGEVADGWYTVDGAPWKVQWNRQHTGKYAKRLVQRDPTAVREPVSGVDAKPEWEYVPGGLRIVAQKGEPMTVEYAAQYGKLYGVCAVCGRTLTFEGSIERGIGPVCYGRIS